MTWTKETIRKALGGKLIGSTFMREMVCVTLLRLPPEMIKKVCQETWFISSQDDAWAFTFRGSDIQDRHLIFLSDELLKQEKSQISYTILHEVGHMVLGHRNSIGFEQTQSEITRQENEADQFAKESLD